MSCHGNNKDHCCTFNGIDCKYLEKDTVPGRRWACGLHVKYGGWEGALNSWEYIKDIAPNFNKKGGVGGAYNCREWPTNEYIQNFPKACCCFKEKVDK